MKVVYVATRNKGKVEEFKAFFASFDYEVKSLLDINPTLEIEETGATFTENALIKARALHSLIHESVIADDSGLQVNVLNNEPGVYSARYAGVESDSHKNNLKLLSKLKDIPYEKRTAQFVCALALVDKDGEEVIFEGSCQGVIATDFKGNNGFGYDPLFYLPELNKTFAEMTNKEKEQVSHRGKALRKLAEYLNEESNNRK